MKEVKAYMDVKEFSQYSGISMSEMRERLLKDPKFLQTVYRFEDGRKFYIKTDAALKVLDELLTPVTQY